MTAGLDKLDHRNSYLLEKGDDGCAAIPFLYCAPSGDAKSVSGSFNFPFCIFKFSTTFAMYNNRPI
jgi:hypothetical protein